MTRQEIINKLLTIADDTNKAVKQAMANNLPFSYLRENAKKETATLLQCFEVYKNLDDDEATYTRDEARPQARNGGGYVVKYIKHGRQFFQICETGIFKHYGRGNFVKL